MADEQEQELSHEELKARVAQLLARNEELENNQAESTQLIGELTQALDNATAGAALSTAVVVSHEGQKYQVIAPKFQHKGTVYEAAALEDHPDVVQELVAAGSELLQPLGQPTEEEEEAETDAAPTRTTRKRAASK